VERECFIRILKLFQGELDLYRELLDVLKKEKKSLVENNIVRLSSLIPLKESLIRKIKSSEEARHPIMAEIAEDMGLEVGELTYHLLRQNAPDDLKGDFDKFEREALSVVEEIKRINAQNADLVTEAAGYVKFLINVITESSGGEGEIKILDKKL